MKSKSIKRKTRKTRKNMMINSKTLKSIKSVKKYTYKNKGGAPAILVARATRFAARKGAAAAKKGAAAARNAAENAVRTAAEKTAEVATAAAEKTAKVATAAAENAAKVGTVVAENAAKVGMAAAKNAAKPAAKVATEAAENAAKPAAKVDKDLETETNPMMKDTSLNTPTPRKAVHNKNSQTYICDPTNFELILPPNHKPSSSVIGKKNNTYFKIPISRDNKAGSTVKFKNKLIIKNVGHKHPNCDKQILNIVNHIPGSGRNEKPETDPNPTKKTINDKLKNSVSQVLSETKLSMPENPINSARQQIISRRLSMTKNPINSAQETPGFKKGHSSVPPERHLPAKYQIAKHRTRGKHK